MSLIDILQLTDDMYIRSEKMSGVVVGIVTNNQDPDGLGRVKLNFPWLSDERESDWARIASLMAGNERGVFFLPDVGDEVLVAFEHGDIRKPVVLGALWNGVDSPPETNEDGENNLRVIKSRSGHSIVFDDSNGSGKIKIKDASEKNTIIIDTDENTITITTDNNIVLAAPQGKITLDCKELELKAGSGAKIEAGQDLDVQARGTLNIKGQTVNIN